MLNWRSAISGPIPADLPYATSPYDTPSQPHQGMWVTKDAHETYVRAIGHADRDLHDPMRPGLSAVPDMSPTVPVAKIDNANVGNAAPPPPQALRVKPEAMENYEQTLGKKFIDLLAIQGKEWTPSTPKAREKNHIAANMRRMRKIQRDSKERAKNAQQPVKALWKSSHYNEAASKLVEIMEDVNPKQPVNATYLRAHSRQGTRVNEKEKIGGSDGGGGGGGDDPLLDDAAVDFALSIAGKSIQTKQSKQTETEEETKTEEAIGENKENNVKNNAIQGGKRGAGEGGGGVEKGKADGENFYNLVGKTKSAAPTTKVPTADVSDGAADPQKANEAAAAAAAPERTVAVTPRMQLKLSNSELKLDLKVLEDAAPLKTEKPVKGKAAVVAAGRQRPPTPTGGREGGEGRGGRAVSARRASEGGGGGGQRPPYAPRPQTARPLGRTKSGDGVAGEDGSAKVSNRPATARMDRNPKDFLIRNDMNFVKVNSKGIKDVKLRKCPSVSHLEDLKKKSEESWESYKKDQWGKIPRYLVDRKEAWKKAEEERIKNIPDPDCPPGHVLMSKEAQASTLAKLESHRNELLLQLGTIPIRADTLRVKQLRVQIEGQLEELDEAIKTFSKPKVFVAKEEAAVVTADPIEW